VVSETKLPDHLGGHMNKTHVDVGVLEIFKSMSECKSFIDVGCGPGGQVQTAARLDFERCVGVDGDWTVLPKNVYDQKTTFYLHDFTKEPVQRDLGYFDLAWSVEFLEHVEEKYIPNYMILFQRSKYIVVTHALPGQAGHHHVNCQEPKYWVDKFAEYDIIYDEALTTKVREASTMAKPFIKRTGLAFVNKRI